MSVHFCVALSTILALALSEISQYEYEWSMHGGVWPECEFEGSASTGGTACVQMSVTHEGHKIGVDVTWAILTAACPELVYAGCADPTWGLSSTEHDMARDLVWMSDSCSTCPRCPCDDGDDSTYVMQNYTAIQSDTLYFGKRCYRCECAYFYRADLDATHTQDFYGRDCTIERSYDEVNEVEDATCPYTGTSEPSISPNVTPSPIPACVSPASSSSIYDVGETFFYSNETGNKSTCAYCLCDSSANLLCERTWADIATNDQLKYLFLDQCGSALGECWDLDDVEAINRWFLQGDVCGCPKCDCGRFTIAAEWNNALQWNSATYDDDGKFSHALFDCVDCQCVAGPQPEMACTAVHHTHVRSTDECLSEISCLDYSGEFQDLHILPWDITQCSKDDEHYCGWEQVQVVGDSGSDTVCVENDIELESMWGCQSDIFCNAFFGYDAIQNSQTGICASTEIAFVAQSYDCLNQEWLSEEYVVDVDYMCCNNNASCNLKPISSENCVESHAIEDYVQLVHECQHSDRGIVDQDFFKAVYCDRDLPAGKYDDDPCELIQTYWTYATVCECSAVQMLESFLGGENLDTAHRLRLESEFDERYASIAANLLGWSEYYHCGLNFTCGIENTFIADRVSTPYGICRVSTSLGNQSTSVCNSEANNKYCCNYMLNSDLVKDETGQLSQEQLFQKIKLVRDLNIASLVSDYFFFVLAVCTCCGCSGAWLSSQRTDYTEYFPGTIKPALITLTVIGSLVDIAITFTIVGIIDQNDLIDAMDQLYQHGCYTEDLTPIILDLNGQFSTILILDAIEGSMDVVSLLMLCCGCCCAFFNDDDEDKCLSALATCAEGVHTFMFAVFDILIISVNVFSFVLPSYETYQDTFNNPAYECFARLETFDTVQAHFAEH